MNEHKSFADEVRGNIRSLKDDKDIQAMSRIWIREIARHKYAYNFSWMGRPLIQFPQDMVAMQQIIWATKPDVIIETGIAHGGSIIYYASLIEMMGLSSKVIGVDIEIRPHNKSAIMDHPMCKHIELIEGSSIAADTVAKVKKAAASKKNVLLVLDSNHTHDHVLEELRLYTPLVSEGNYVVVFDTLIEDMPDDLIVDRPWKQGNNPKTAVKVFLSESGRFIVDDDIDAQLLITAAPGGFLKCIKNI